MTDEKRISERDAILRERAAFALGRCAALHETNIEWDESCGMCQDRAKQKFPLPKVTRPRVVIEPRCRMAWKFEDGAFYYSLSSKKLEWLRDNPEDVAHELTTARVAMWADLLANPTEEVGADAEERKP